MKNKFSPLVGLTRHSPDWDIPGTLRTMALPAPAPVAAEPPARAANRSLWYMLKRRATADEGATLLRQLRCWFSLIR
jgi:hypothetical protein